MVWIDPDLTCDHDTRNAPDPGCENCLQIAFCAADCSGANLWTDKDGVQHYEEWDGCTPAQRAILNNGIIE